MKKPVIFSVFLSLIIYTVLIGFINPTFPSDSRLEFIINQFNKYISVFHQNKVYIQTDKNEYESGETIFLKAYVIDGAEKLPESVVKNLYVEIIAPDKSPFMTQLLKIENGIAKGNFPVIDTIKTGLYLMRAYTQNMKSSGNNYLFSKELRIVHPFKLYYDVKFHRQAKKILKQKPDIDLQFFPEGGQLVDNIKNTLAFKAIDQNGKAIDIEGKIYTGKNIPICDFKSDYLGMGKIEFTPLYKQKYYAIISDEKGKPKRVELPDIIEKGYVLNVNDKDKAFEVSITTNKMMGDDPVAKTVYLIIQSGGKIYSSGQHLMDKNQIKLTIGKKILPTGVAHFTLFDGQGKPQCERLVFVNHKDFLKIESNFNKKQYSKKDKIEFDIQVTDNNGEPAMADLGVTVRLKTGFGHQNPDILSYLLLQADLQGKIENPQYYFGDGKDVSSNLDILMLTQGWRKFLWNNILGDSIVETEFPVETDLRITGQITQYFFGISENNASVTMTLLDKFNDVYKTKTTKKGYFEFTGLNYSDTMDVLIEFIRDDGRKNIMAIIDEPRKIDNDFNPYKGFYLDSLKIRHKPEFIKYSKASLDSSKPIDNKLYGTPSQTIVFTDDMRSSGRSVMDILKSRVLGLTGGQRGYMLRGPTSLMLSNTPLYLLDGVPVSYQTIETMNVFEVDYVDILKGTSSAIYGIRGSNGVIAVYTRNGFFMKRGELHFKMLGYQTPKKFYSPKYIDKDKSESIIDKRKTIFWEPSLKIDENGRAHLEFYHSDIQGEFEIVIEGMDKNGKIGIYKLNYEVNE